MTADLLGVSEALVHKIEKSALAKLKTGLLELERNGPCLQYILPENTFQSAR